MKKENKFLPIIGIGVFLLYFLYNECSTLPFILFGIDYSKITLFIKIIYLIVYEFIFVSILYFIFRKRIIQDFIDFKQNFKPYIKKYIEYWILAFGLMALSNILIITFFPDSIANNQKAIEEIFTTAPLYMIVSAVIFAPLIEELVFRLGFRYMFKNDWLFIITSGLVFGAMHVVGSFTTWIDLIYIIPYSIPGIIFAYTLVKSKNIFVPMSLHFIHNTFMILLQIIVMLFV